METIEVNDDVVLKFKQKSIVEVYEYEDAELDSPIEENFEEGEEIEITICGVDADKFDVQFDDGTIAFIRKDSVEIVSVN
jgi:preprotein translocase subunit YajC